jgi:hypothetical protein
MEKKYRMKVLFWYFCYNDQFLTGYDFLCLNVCNTNTSSGAGCIQPAQLCLGSVVGITKNSSTHAQYWSTHTCSGYLNGFHASCFSDQVTKI